MNKLSPSKRAAIVSALVEGNSIRATCRMTDTAKGTVLKLLVDLGRACTRYHNENVRGLTCRRVQADEIWSFCYAKDKNIPASMKAMPGVGSMWTWSAICADSKLIVSWLVGSRDAGYAHEFMQDVRSRLSNRVQLSTDGLKLYLEAVEDAFGSAVDYAQLVKIYGEAPEGQRRYSPAECIGTRKIQVSGNPDPDHVSTSYIERANLTMRMSMRRFTRLTNGFSKKVENLEAAVALHFMHYNFCRIHQTLRVTPAMAAGISNHAWELSEIVSLLA
jgi:IS1 family transposase